MQETTNINPAAKETTPGRSKRAIQETITIIKSLSIMGLSPYYTPVLRKVAKNYPSDFISLA